MESITAGRDEAVSPDAARTLHLNLRYVEIEEALHMMTPDHWAWSIRESVGWLSRFTA